MFRLIFIPFILLALKSFSQSTETRKLTVYMEYEKEPFSGATLYVANSNPSRGSMTDYFGVAILDISDLDKRITITPFNPPIELNNFQVADSIHINLDKIKIRYFKDGKRIRRRFGK